MENLNKLEKQVIEMLLAGDDPVLIALRKQIQSTKLKERKLTGVGFFLDFEMSVDVPVIPGVANFEIGDVSCQVPGLEHGLGFLLFVRNGRLKCLEGYTYDEPWPTELETFTLNFNNDLSAFRTLKSPK
jgi:hypothetical protein